MTALSLFSVFVYLAGVFATSIYCAGKTPKDDRVPWILIIIFVPFGWIGFWMFAPPSVAAAEPMACVPLSNPIQTENEIAVRVIANLEAEKGRRQSPSHEAPKS